MSLLDITRTLTDLDLDMTVLQLRVLLEIEASPGITGKAIADRIGTSPATITRTVDIWSKVGHKKKAGRRLVRRTLAADNREKNLELTSKGKKFLRDLGL
tara:strand:+ start:2450 stop:2749 length:300 start_codon:yes stop_codon:yes gene_type:complete